MGLKIVTKKRLKNFNLHSSSEIKSYQHEFDYLLSSNEILNEGGLKINQLSKSQV